MRRSTRHPVVEVNDRLGVSVVYNLSEVFGLLFGSIVLAIALLRARVVPLVLPILPLVGVVARFTLAGSYAGVLRADGLSLIAFAGIGVLVLGDPTRRWEDPHGS